MTFDLFGFDELWLKISTRGCSSDRGGVDSFQVSWIRNGQYAQWLKAYNLTNEAVETSEVNPPGLPITNE